MLVGVGDEDDDDDDDGASSMGVGAKEAAAEIRRCLSTVRYICSEFIVTCEYVYIKYGSRNI